MKRKFHFSGFNRSSLFIFSMILIIFCVILCFHFINVKASPVIMDYAEMEARKLSSIVINKAISKHITEQVNGEELFEITKDDNGDIRSIDFNTTLINKFLTETTNSVQMNLRNIEKGDIDAVEFSDSVLVDYDKEDLEKGIVFQISSGALFGNPVVANIGPKIPVKLSLVGDATSNISADVKDYGINSALISVYVNLKISEQIILPFFKQVIEIETKAPVALKVVTGSVPKYYSNGLSQDSPSVVVPTEENE